MQVNGNIDRAEAESEIVEILGPYVGRSMARAAVEAHASRMKIEGGWLSREQLDQLVDRLAQGLRIFVGREKSDNLARQILMVIGKQEST